MPSMSHYFSDYFFLKLYTFTCIYSIALELIMRNENHKKHNNYEIK